MTKNINLHVSEIIKGKGSGLRGSKASDFLEKKIKERGVIIKRYQIALRNWNDKAVWQRILKAKLPLTMSLAEDAGGSYDTAIFVGAAKDINLYKANLKKQGIVVRSNALVLK